MYEPKSNLIEELIEELNHRIKFLENEVEKTKILLEAVSKLKELKEPKNYYHKNEKNENKTFVWR